MLSDSEPLDAERLDEIISAPAFSATWREIVSSVDALGKRSADFLGDSSSESNAFSRALILLRGVSS
jgi:hypothetical protein